MDIRSRHWLVAASVAALAHLAVIVGMRKAPPAPPTPTPVVIQLGEMGAPEGASGGGSADAAGGPGEALSPVAAAQPLPASEPIKAQVVEMPRQAVAVAKPKPKPKPKPTPKPKPKPKQVEKPKPKPEPTVRRRSQATPSNSEQSSKSQTSGTGRATGNRSGGQGTGSGKTGSGSGKGGSGSGKGSGSGSGTKGTANYHGKLAAWLNRHKRYPNRARRMRQEGTVKVTFTIDRRGRLLSHRIVARSGHTLLDQEVESMLRRASPLPPFPADMSQSRLTVTVPIRFNLR